MLGLALNNWIIAKRDYTTIGGRSRGLGQAGGGRWRYVGLFIVVSYLFIALLLPIAAMAVTSLQPFPSVRFFSINWTLDNYRYIFTFPRSEEHTSELQSLIRISYAVFCLKKKKEKKS